jgi:hypothetical protein
MGKNKIMLSKQLDRGQITDREYEAVCNILCRAIFDREEVCADTICQRILQVLSLQLPKSIFKFKK